MQKLVELVCHCAACAPADLLFLLLALHVGIGLVQLLLRLSAVLAQLLALLASSCDLHLPLGDFALCLRNCLQ